MALTPGITVVLNGRDVALEQVSLSVADGAKFRLSDPVYIGRPSDFAAFVGQAFGIADAAAKITEKINALPEPLKGMASLITSVEVTVDDFEVTVPSTPAPGAPAPTTFKVGLTGSWSADAIPLVPSATAGGTPILAIKAIYLVIDDKP